MLPVAPYFPDPARASERFEYEESVLTRYSALSSEVMKGAQGTHRLTRQSRRDEGRWCWRAGLGLCFVFALFTGGAIAQEGPTTEDASVQSATGPVNVDPQQGGDGESPSALSAEEARAREARDEEVEKALGTAPVVVQSFDVEWHARFQTALDAGELDEFYLRELRPALREADATLGSELGGLSTFFRPRTKRSAEEPDLEELFAQARVLYRLRVEALTQVSGRLHERVHGFGNIGRREFLDEIGYVALGAQWDVYTIVKQQEVLALEAIERDPIYVLSKLLQIMFALLLFRWWRKRAPPHFDSGIAWFLKRRPRKRSNLRAAGVLWYVQNVRGPLEWLALIGAAFEATHQWLPNFLKLFWPIALWVLTARFVVLLINAIVKRGAAGMRRDSSGIRLRSLRLVAFWVVLVGLGRGLASTLAGEAVIYAWVGSVGRALGVPLALILLVWWKPEVFYRMQQQRPQTSFSKGILDRSKGLESYGATIVGGLRLSWEGLRRWFLRRLAGFEEGRRALATFAHIEAVRTQDRLGEFEGAHPVAEKMKRRLVDSPVASMNSYASPLMERLLKIIQEKRHFVTMIVGERGLGKTTLLERLAEEAEGDALIIDCPAGGVDAFIEWFAEVLGIQEQSPEAFEKALAARNTSFIGIDNAHHLVRPYAGGHVDLDRLGKFTRSIGAGFTWLITIEGTTWQYVKRARVIQALQNEELLLPSWTEDQLTKLIDAKCESLGIKPDFSYLVLPALYDEVTRSDRTEHNRAGYFRTLWTASEANPEVAVRFFADSLVVGKKGKLLVKLFDRRDNKELQRLHISVRLVLRFLAMSELATAEEIDRGLRLGPNIVEAALLLCELRGYTEQRHGRYRLTWPWFRSITQLLSRQNLLARSKTGVAQ